MYFILRIARILWVTSICVTFSFCSLVHCRLLFLFLLFRLHFCIGDVVCACVFLMPICTVAHFTLIHRNRIAKPGDREWIMICVMGTEREVVRVDPKKSRNGSRKKTALVCKWWYCAAVDVSKLLVLFHISIHMWVAVYQACNYYGNNNNDNKTVKEMSKKKTADIREKKKKKQSTDILALWCSKTIMLTSNIAHTHITWSKLEKEKKRICKSESARKHKKVAQTHKNGKNSSWKVNNS